MNANDIGTLAQDYYDWREQDLMDGMPDPGRIESALEILLAAYGFCEDTKEMERKLAGSHPMEAVGYLQAIADVRRILGLER